MASRALPPRKKKSRQPAPTAILALSDDLLREVFLRLPSLPSLVRAALACPAFLRAVRSSPAFRRRFCDLHPPPILGAFLLPVGRRMPTFSPLRLGGRRSHPDHAAALRGLDVFFTRFPDAIGDQKDDGEDEDEGWYMSECRDGYVVLVTPRVYPKKVAVYDPLTGALHRFPEPPVEVFGGDSDSDSDEVPVEAEFHVIPSEADDRSFRVLCVLGADQIAILSPGKREWQITPVAEELQDAGSVTLARNGIVYWAGVDEDSIAVLNTATLQFSQINTPIWLSGGLGETNDGNLCFVNVSEDDLALDVWIRRAGDDGVDRWMQDMTFQLQDAINELALGITVTAECELAVVSISSGIVYLDLQEEPRWLLSFCLETRKLQKLCPISNGSCHPYIMAWPPSFVGNMTTGLSS